MVGSFFGECSLDPEPGTPGKAETYRKSKSMDEVQVGRERVGWSFGCNLGLRTLY